jgi:hypothetical protein
MNRNAWNRLSEDQMKLVVEVCTKPIQGYRWVPGMIIK